MNSKETQTAFRVLVSITTPKLADKAAELFILDNIPLQYECTAVGTAPNEMIDVLGLGNPDKVLLISYVPKDIADVMLKKLKKELKLGTINSGIAFTLPLKNATNLIVKMFENFYGQDEEKTERKVNLQMNENKYFLIAAVVNQGYSENVMEAARGAGAGGGTVVPSRSIVNEKAIGFWGTTIQDEKDMIFIVADEEKRLDIMQAISSKCGMHSEAKGLIISLPIDNVIGIDRDDD